MRRGTSEGIGKQMKQGLENVAGFLKKKPQEPPANAAVIATLEEALELAKAGDLTTIALAGKRADGAVYTNYVTDDTLRSIGDLEFLKGRITHRIFGGQV